jgi:ribosomal protein S27E
MQHFAMQVQCLRCDNRFVVGGGSQSDVTLWLERQVRCPACDTLMVAHEGAIVCLRDLVAGATGASPRMG